MYLITNREIISGKGGLERFGKNPHSNGAHEINIYSVKRKGDGWVSNVVSDKLELGVVKDLKKKYKIDIDVKEKWHGSLQLACEVFELAMETKKSILFFVHGYNNDVEDIVLAAEAIEALYDVIVIPFSWPANGGNVVTGVASYLSDKADARQSSQALNRVIGKLSYFHRLLTKARLDKLRKKASDKHPDNLAAANQLFTKLQAKECQSKISLLCHSMGNYVLKHTLMTGDRLSNKLVFDNICLVAADVNSKDHERWVDKLDVRNRCYIVINEGDSALAASRIKPGDEQLVRLGHHVQNLRSESAYYIDVTDVKGVGSEHAYFKGAAVDNNSVLKRLFKEIFHGRSIEKELSYLRDKNLYELPTSALIEQDSFFDDILE